VSLSPNPHGTRVYGGSEGAVDTGTPYGGRCCVSVQRPPRVVGAVHANGRPRETALETTIDPDASNTAETGAHMPKTPQLMTARCERCGHSFRMAVSDFMTCYRLQTIRFYHPEIMSPTTGMVLCPLDRAAEWLDRTAAYMLRVKNWKVEPVASTNHDLFHSWIEMLRSSHEWRRDDE